MSERSKVRSALKRIRSLYVAVDAAMKGAHARYSSPCSEGCSYCCRQMVAASIPESLIMLEGIVDDLEKRRWFRTRLPILAEQLKYLLAPGTTVSSWFKRQIPCVFLYNDRCRVYSDRPLACRVQMTAEKDSSFCKEVGKEQYLALVDGGRMVEAGIQESLVVKDKLGIIMGYAPMQASLLWAWEIYTKGIDVFRRDIEDTPFGDDLAMAAFWAKLELGPKYTEEEWQQMKDKEK